MTGRRKFIRKSALSLTAGLFLDFDHFSRNGKTLVPVDPQDDDFWAQVRKKFPLTKERVYLNNGTIGPSPYQVLDAVKNTLDSLNEWGEYKGQDDSRQPLADFTFCTKEEICLTHNTTEGINIVASGLPLQRGDEVIMTTHEHVGNALPWLNQKKEKGIVIRPFVPADTAVENLNKINDLITEKTRVIAVPHITCTTGHVLPVKEISRLARDKNILSFFDGAHAAGSMQLNMPQIGSHFYASCGHKWLLGPSGTGFLYINEEVLDLLHPHAVGAYSDLGWELSENRQEVDGYVKSAHRFDYGTQSAALSHGLKAAVEFMDEIGMDKVEAYSRSLATRLFQKLSEIGDPVQVLTPAEEESRSTMISFRIRNMNFRDFGKIASENKFRIRLVPESKLDAIRISTHIYNNIEQIDSFAELVSKVVNS